MRIAFCGEYNSANFGDGIIQLGLSSIVDRVFPEADVNYFDLSARPKPRNIPRIQQEADRPNFLVRCLSLILKRPHQFLYASSTSYAQYMISARIDCARLRKYFCEALSGVDFLVIGGGQLLIDNNLSFPVKLEILIKCAEAKGIRVGFFSVGVGKIWSARGAKYLERNMLSHSVQWVSCRDQLSADRLRDIVPQMRGKIHVTVDAALALSPVKRGQASRAVGLGIISPFSVRANGVSNRMSRYTTADKLWCDFYSELSSRGFRVVLFCNGSKEDAIYLHRVQSKLRKSAGIERVEVFVPKDKHELIRFLSFPDSIVAARLHANIVAHALGVPSVALVWDDKVTSFMDYVGRSEFALEGSDISVHKALEVMDEVGFYAIVNRGQYGERLAQDFSNLMGLQ